MINFIKKYKTLIIEIAILILLVIMLVVCILLKQNPEIAEAWTRGFGNFYATIFSRVFSWIPFSFTEVSIVALVVFSIIFLVKIIISLVKLKIIPAITKFLAVANAIVAVFLVYTMSCEFAYNRAKVDLPFYETKVEASEFKYIYNYYAEDLNYCISQMKFLENGDIDSSLSVLEISYLVEEAYNIITSDYYFLDSKSHAKPMMSSFIYREFQITGVTFAPYTEPNVNYLATKMELPFTIAHEFAHTKGVMRENDANQLAFYVCLNSSNPYLRFSAYGLFFYQMRSMASPSYIPQEDIQELIPVDPNYSKAVRFANNYWKEHDLLAKIGDYINNLYITSSGVSEGTESYSGGTQIDTDPVTLELRPSLYQKLFFEKYFRNK